MQSNCFRTLQQSLVALGFAALISGCGGGGTTTDTVAGAIAPANATGLRALPAAFTTQKAVAYSPFRTAANEPGRATENITDAMVKEDLDLLVTAGIGLIRLFDSSDKVAVRTLRVIAANNIPIKVMLGVYVNSFENVTNPTLRANIQSGNSAEIALGVALANSYPTTVVAVSVGNETMVSWSFVPVSTTTMASYIKTVRDQIAQPVTTDDNWAFYAGIGRSASEQAAEVLRQIDFASIHTYAMLDAEYSNFSDSDTGPDWDWQQRGVTDPTLRAAAMMDAAIAKTQKDYNAVRSFLDTSGRSGMPIIIGETGWKASDSSGSGRYKFTAHPVNQKMYYDRLIAWAAASVTGPGPKAIVYFEAFDEPWKQSDDKWGLFNVARQARCVAQGMNTTATWAKEAGSCAASAAVYFAPPVLNPAVTSTLVIHSESVTGYPVGMKADPYEGSTYTLGYGAAFTGDSAPGDIATSGGLPASHYISLSAFTPKNYGWGLLWQSSAATPVSANMSNFASGTIRFSVKTAYGRPLRIGISSDTELGSATEAFVTLSGGTYGYCANSGTTASATWCNVSIPVAAFKTANPALDLRYILTRFSVSDVDSGLSSPGTGLQEIRLDNIYWQQ